LLQKCKQLLWVFFNKFEILKKNYAVNPQKIKMNYKGRFLSFKIKGRKSKISGVVLNWNKDWTLIRRCIDYSVDGYSIIRNKNLTFFYEEYEQRANKILKIKNYNYKSEPKIPIDNLLNIIKYIDKNYKIIQVDTKDGEAFDLLKFKYFENMTFYFDELLANGKWRDVMKFKENVFRVITFDTDYSNSLSLITKIKK
jgi:hypothetical protein